MKQLKIGHNYRIYGKFPDMKRAMAVGDGVLVHLLIHAYIYHIQNPEHGAAVLGYVDELREYHPEAVWTIREVK
jgi:hypothetical protein